MENKVEKYLELIVLPEGMHDRARKKIATWTEAELDAKIAEATDRLERARKFNEKAQKLADTLSVADLHKRYMVAQQYQMDLYRINEQSDAADMEEIRIMESMSLIQKAIKLAKEKDNGISD